MSDPKEEFHRLMNDSGNLDSILSALNLFAENKDQFARDDANLLVSAMPCPFFKKVALYKCGISSSKPRRNMCGQAEKFVREMRSFTSNVIQIFVEFDFIHSAFTLIRKRGSDLIDFFLSLLHEKDTRLERLYAFKIYNAARILVYPIDLPPVLFVGDEEALSQAVDVFQMELDVVGMDIEWKPVRRRGVQARPSILQLSTRRHGVFIFDLLRFVKTNKEAQTLISLIFRNENIVKAGVGILDDFRNMAQCYHWIDCFASARSICDLSSLFKKVYKNEVEISLTNLTVYSTGSQLSKSQQMSNWDRRPLYDAQLQYSALDAWCVHSIVDVLLNAYEEMNGEKPILLHGLLTCDWES